MLFSPLKIGVFFVTFECTSQGYVERELLSLCSRKWRTLIQGSLSSPLKSGGFFGTFECTSKGYVVRKISLLSKVMVFCGTSVALLNAPVRGM